MRHIWHKLRGMLCVLLGHKLVGDQHRKLCVYCWKEVRVRYRPGADNVNNGANDDK